jgi:uncharacterized RDD family membrane protein YckC
VSELPSYPRGASEREEAQGPPAEAEEIRYSGWWRRAAALLVDSLVIGVLIIVPLLLAALVAAVNEGVGIVLVILGVIFAIGAPIFYTIYLTGKEPGQTVGKKALGIRVRHAELDRAIGYGPSAGRYLITFAFGILYIPLLVDYLWPLWDKRNQALHDKVANSIVVRVNP